MEEREGTLGAILRGVVMTRLWDVGCGFALGLVVMFAASGNGWGVALYLGAAALGWRAPRVLLRSGMQDGRQQFHSARVAMKGKR